MGTFYFPVTLRKPEGQEQIDLKLLVNTGATYTWVPEDILEELGLTPSLTRRVKLADGQILARGAVIVLITIEKETLPTLCLFGTRGSEPLLGAVTLEEFGLGVDPVGKTLIPVVGHLASLSQETMAEQLDPEFQKSLQQSMDEYRRGDIGTVEDIRRILRRKDKGRA